MNAGEFARRRARIEDEAWRRSSGFVARAMDKLVRDAEAEPVMSGAKLVAWRMPNGATVCKKRRYKSEPEVLEVLEGMVLAQRRHKVPSRAYQCQHCGGWHLTSQNRLH